MQIDETLLANNSQHWWELLHPFARFQTLLNNMQQYWELLANNVAFVWRTQQLPTLLGVVEAMSTVYRTAFPVNMKRYLVQFERQRQRTNRSDTELCTRKVICGSEASIYADTPVQTAEIWKKNRLQAKDTSRPSLVTSLMASLLYPFSVKTVPFRYR